MRRGQPAREELRGGGDWPTSTAVPIAGSPSLAAVEGLHNAGIDSVRPVTTARFMNAHARAERGGRDEPAGLAEKGKKEVWHEEHTQQDTNKQTNNTNKEQTKRNPASHRRAANESTAGTRGRGEDTNKGEAACSLWLDKQKRKRVDEGRKNHTPRGEEEEIRGINE